MMKARRVVFLLFLLSTIPAFGASMDMFTLTDGTDTATFSLPSAPVSPGGFLYFFVINNVPVTIDGIVYPTDITFYNGTGYNSGGLLISDPQLPSNAQMDNSLIEQAGPDLFAGPVNSPVFLTGNFPSVDFIGSGGPVGKFVGNFDIVITPEVTTTPEPSSFVLFGTALGSLLWLKRLTTSIA